MKWFSNYIAYLQDNPKGYWFKRKLFGWGWTPATWQGWVVTLGHLIAILAFAFTLDETASEKDVLFTFVLPLLLLTISLIVIAYKKGEPPKWQWGLHDKKEDDTQQY